MRIRRLRLGGKIFVFLAAIILLPMVVYALIYSDIYREFEEERLGSESIKTLYSLETSLETVIRNADDYSKMLLADSAVQERMEHLDLLSDVSAQNRLITHIYSILQFSESADAIWLIDDRNQKLRVGGIASTSANFDIDLYRELRTSYGSPRVMVDTDGRSSTLTLVRSYNSLKDFRSLGLIGVEISEKRILTIIREIIDTEHEPFFILDEENRILYGSDRDPESPFCRALLENCDFSENAAFFGTVQVEHRRYTLTGVDYAARGWRICRFAPVPNFIGDSRFLVMNVLLMITVGLLILLGVFLITGLLRTPIRQLLTAMGGGASETPVRVRERPYLEEFRVLFKGYNQMVARNEQLVRETVEKQKRIRQVELNEIQEQMKPHFLYNTLDSIEALAMMGDSKTVGELIEALGGFYRKSVSGGREFLTIREEFEMTRDYARIMHIRFGDTFCCDIRCDEDCADFLIPKLTIQPLVENAFQHGIRGRLAFGRIELRAVREGGAVVITITDNGTGIPEEVIRELEEMGDGSRRGSLGLRGTIYRLKLIYGEAFSYEIGSGECSRIELRLDSSVLKEQRDDEAENDHR